MAPTAQRSPPSNSVGLNGYLIFVVSWFLHVPARIPVLGALRVDLLLIAFLAYVAMAQRRRAPSVPDPHAAKIDKALRVLMVFAIFMIPFVEWPGSVVKGGIPNFVKAVVFYYFTVAFIRTEADLRKFIFVFVLCQTFRVLEPLFLHLAFGYWGSAASLYGGAESMNRLSGSPSDVVNPNGFAFICCIVLLFLYFFRETGKKYYFAFLLMAPACIFALSLSGSRSGMLALVVILGGIILKSKYRAALAVSLVIAAIVSFPLLSPDMQDRYLSIIGQGKANAATADERVGGMQAQWDVAMRRPFSGYGLGTSPEANVHYTVSGPYIGKPIPAHNLYLEVLQELGFVGLALFLVFLWAVISSFLKMQPKRLKSSASPFLARTIDALQIWLAAELLASFVSYGLSNYGWYLLAGFSIVIRRLAAKSPAP